MSETKRVVQTESAPKAIGPYSQAIRAGDLLFLSGQIALDPKTGAMIGAGDVRAETRALLANLRAVLAAEGLDFSHVVRCTVFLRDFADFAAMNEVYAEAFAVAPPARTTVAVSGLPKDARVEIDAIARAVSGRA